MQPRDAIARLNRRLRSVCKLRALLLVLLFAAGLCTVPHWWCGRGVQAWYAGEPAVQGALARSVEDWVRADLGAEDFSTGSGQYSGEWLFGTYFAAGLGFGQTALEHPEWRARNVELMRLCIKRMISPQVRAFDTDSWDEDAFVSLPDLTGHAAYLGYLNLLLSLNRLVDPEQGYAALNDEVTEALERRVWLSPTFLLETYPDETYPVDNCAVMAGIALHGRATGADHSRLIAAWTSALREHYVDPATGLLYQAADSGTGAPLDAPRGSGTCLGLYMLSFMDRQVSRQLYDAAASELVRNALGFGAVREYPSGVAEQRIDIDSGPIVFGYGASATGFMIGGARIHGDRALYSRLYASAVLVGAPLARGDRTTFVTGGPLGDALLFAMLTAQPRMPAPRGATP
jgi:hypothetical protein